MLISIGQLRMQRRSAPYDATSPATLSSQSALSLSGMAPEQTFFAEGTVVMQAEPDEVSSAGCCSQTRSTPAPVPAGTVVEAVEVQRDRQNAEPEMDRAQQVPAPGQ